MSIFILFSLVLSIVLSQSSTKIVYASDTYQENVHYEKTVTTRCNYSYFECKFDVKIEYYFVNTIAPITDLELDTDGDLLPDYLEVLYLTDLNNPDTDSDGIPDGIEVYKTFTDPMRVDTDNNAISDGDEDYDKDGLSNSEEVTYGTDLTLIDSDFDSLSDYDEINGAKTKNGLYTYMTDPLSEDSDGDTLRDDVELKLNLNPNNPYDKDTKVYQEIDRTLLPIELSKEATTPIYFYGEVKGLIDENVSATLATNNYYDSLRGKIGEPIRIDTTYGGSDGLKVAFDLTKYKDKKKRINIYRYDNGKLEMVKNTFLDGNILKGDCYSGEYVLVDSKVLLQDVNIFIN